MHSADEKELRKLIAALRMATVAAGQELSQAFNEVNSLVLELQSRRESKMAFEAAPSIFGKK